VTTPDLIAAYARCEARRAISVRRVDPDGAERIVQAARAECERMRAAAGLGTMGATFVG